MAGRQRNDLLAMDYGHGAGQHDQAAVRRYTDGTLHSSS
jgi:hypothetical protein